MKKCISTLVLVMAAMLLQAQEVMKVELKKGETVEYKVDEVQRVYFDTIIPSEEEDDIKTTYLIMFVGDKKSIEGTVNTAVSENDFVASVSGNVVTASHTGATIIVVNEKHPVIIMVFSLNTSIPDPVLKWGEPKDTIKAHHTKGTIYKDDATSLYYKNCGDAQAIGYTFDENGKLKGAALSVASSKSTTLLNYLLDRYLIYPELQDGEYYLGVDGYDEKHITTIVSYYPKDNMCIFIPYSKSKEKGSESREILSREMKEAMLEE